MQVGASLRLKESKRLGRGDGGAVRAAEREYCAGFDTLELYRNDGKYAKMGMHWAMALSKDIFLKM